MNENWNAFNMGELTPQEWIKGFISFEIPEPLQEKAMDFYKPYFESGETLEKNPPRTREGKRIKGSEGRTTI